MRSEEQIKTSKLLDPERIQLSRKSKQGVQLTISEEGSYSKIKIVRAFPLSHPDRYVAFLDDKDEEIGMVKDPKELDPQSRKIVEGELDKRYLVSIIKKIRSIRTDFGTSYWDVDTNRGRRDFVIQGVQDNVVWLGERRLLLVDVDGNRFEIPDYSSLDKKSASLLEEVLF
ncbi:hypothetical protein DRQ00_05870 [candidate division KSB1 bacterium]|nr:MAG: hypothetical protein DRQ00_05870 [candidate division KSB1 bacterium]